jgi:hypothetical protein
MIGIHNIFNIDLTITDMAKKKRRKAKKKTRELNLTKAPEIGDKSILYLLVFAVVVANLANTYFVLQMNQNIMDLGEAIMKIPVNIPQGNPSGDNQPTQPEPQEDPTDLLESETKALIENYQVSGTPTLVINCDKMRVGTYALAEERGALPEGSALQAFINDLCDITGEGSVFCNDVAETDATGISVQTTFDDGCGSAEKVKIYAFHSPTCGFCDSQDAVIEAIENKYPNNVEIIIICTPIHGANDVTLCKQQTDKYDMI